MMITNCSEHDHICHLFELILVIHANTSNETNHGVYHVFVGIPRSHVCYHMLTYHAQVNMSYHKLTCHAYVKLLVAKMRWSYPTRPSYEHTYANPTL
jgi:hypothetical protein